MHEIVQKFSEKYGRLPTERDPDYLEMLRMSKYQVIPFPSFKPSKCANCGSSKTDDRQYVDFGLEVDWYGIVYLCTLCLNDIAREAGLFIEYGNKLATAQLEIELLKKKLEQGVELPDNLVKAWEEFKEYYASIQPARDDSSTPVNDSPPDNPFVQESNQTESDKRGSTQTKSRATKSTTSTGRKDVPSLASILGDTDS